MKIAIITIHGYFNYGNRLQNYALQSVLEKYDADVSTWAVNGDCSKLKRAFKPLVERVDGKRKLKAVRDIIRERNFKKFSDRLIRTQIFSCPDGRFPQMADEDIDVFVAGSDQVWNPMFWSDCENSVDAYNYCLGFTVKRKIAYAASFGVGEIPARWKERLEPLLSQFDGISVRELEGVDILRDMNCEAVTVLDPTLLLTADEWRKVESCELKENRRYILTYFLGEQSEENWKKIYEEAEKEKLEVIDLMNPKGPFYVKGPETFLELIDKAETVYTDSFHACVFSMLFHTPFVVFDRKHRNRSSMSSRISTLLSKAGVLNGISKDTFILLDEFEEMDKKLYVEREKSLQFLAEVLSW